MTSFNIIISHRPNRNVSEICQLLSCYMFAWESIAPLMYVCMYWQMDVQAWVGLNSLSAFFPLNTMAAEWDVLGLSFKNARIGQLRRPIGIASWVHTSAWLLLILMQSFTAKCLGLKGNSCKPILWNSLAKSELCLFMKNEEWNAVSMSCVVNENHTHTHTHTRTHAHTCTCITTATFGYVDPI